MNPLLLGFLSTWLMIIALVAVIIGMAFIIPLPIHEDAKTQFWLGTWLALAVLIVMVVGCLAWLES